MSIVAGVAIFVLALVWLVTMADVLHRQLGWKRTSAWLLIVLLVPVFGALAYWVTRMSPAAGAQPPTSR